MVKNCDLGIENAAVFSRPRSQFFTIRTSQPANNIYVLTFFFMSSLKGAKRVLLVRDIAMYFLRVDTHRILLPENGVNHVRVD